MKNYDLNQDGYISLEDFEKIAANFPFTYCTQETDRWGCLARPTLQKTHNFTKSYPVLWCKIS